MHHTKIFTANKMQNMCLNRIFSRNAKIGDEFFYEWLLSNIQFTTYQYP